MLNTYLCKKRILKLSILFLVFSDSVGIPSDSHGNIRIPDEVFFVIRLESMTYRHKMPCLPNFLREKKFNFYNV